MLQIDNIDVYYGDVQALWDISLEVKGGEIVSLVGPNGAGKDHYIEHGIRAIETKKR